MTTLGRSKDTLKLARKSTVIRPLKDASCWATLSREASGKRKPTAMLPALDSDRLLAASRPRAWLTFIFFPSLGELRNLKNLFSPNVGNFRYEMSTWYWSQSSVTTWRDSQWRQNDFTTVIEGQCRSKGSANVERAYFEESAHTWGVCGLPSIRTARRSETPFRTASWTVPL